MAKKAKKTKETIEIKETGKCCFCDKVYENSGHNTVGYWKEEEEKKAMVNSSVVVMNVTKPNFFLR